MRESQLAGLFVQFDSRLLPRSSQSAHDILERPRPRGIGDDGSPLGECPSLPPRFMVQNVKATKLHGIKEVGCRVHPYMSRITQFFERIVQGRLVCILGGHDIDND